MAAIALFTDKVLRSIKEPSGGNLIWLAFWVVAIVLMMFGLRKCCAINPGNASKDNNENHEHQISQLEPASLYRS